MAYTPLEFSRLIMENNGFNEVYRVFKDEYNFIDNNVSVEEFSDFIHSMDFMNKNYKGKLKKLNDVVLYNKFINEQLMPEINMRDIDRRKTEWQDFLLYPYTIDKWSKFKRVYKIDKDFYEALVKTKELSTTYEMMSKLPVGTFYIDLEDINSIKPMLGAFVDIYFKGLYCMVKIYMTALPDKFFSYYTSVDFSNRPDAKIRLKDMPDADFYYKNIVMDGENQTFEFRKINEEDKRKEITLAIFQIIMFLAASNKDLKENDNTKRTYRPSATVKNKFSEINMWDVGVRYGKAIRTAKEEVQKISLSENNNGIHGTHKSPRPHIRNAHWQRYHVGEGRKEIITKWIPPIFVMGEQEIPVTIQKIED